MLNILILNINRLRIIINAHLGLSPSHFSLLHR